MKKRSKIGWIILFLATVTFLVVKNYADARFFDKLNIFHKKDAVQTVAPPKANEPENASDMTGTSKTIQEQAEEMKEQERSLEDDLKEDGAPQL